MIEGERGRKERGREKGRRGDKRERGERRGEEMEKRK